MATKNTKSAKQNRPRRFAEARGSAAIRRELNRVQKEMTRAQQGNRHQLYGAQQALCWALHTESMSPSKAFAEVERC